MQRRHFLQAASTSLIATQTSGLVSAAQAAIAADSRLECRAFLPDGEPLPADSFDRLYFLSLEDEPLPNPERTVKEGVLRSQAPTQWPIAIALQCPVQGFGEVTLYADNRGRGFLPGDFPLVLNREFARDRYIRVTQAIDRWRRQSIVMPPSIRDRLAQSQALFQQAETHPHRPLQVRLWNEALSQALWAGEEAVLSRARQRIATTPPRHEFKFGCNAFGHPTQGEDYDRYFTQLFNFATVPFYWRSFEPAPNAPGFNHVDRQVNWLRNAGITPKGHPLVWFHDVGIPDWIAQQPYHAVKLALRQRILEVTQHYGDRIPYYDVINEAHDVPWANDLGYSAEQFLDLTRLASEVAKEGNPHVQRIINSCCLWARQVALYGPPRRSPYQYVRACIAAEIPFEIIGLQLYYPDQDMFEIDRLLERFIRLGKPIHITEMAVSSNTGMDEDSLLGAARGLWHAPWTETVQADWVEQVYTLAYSKPEIEAVTWWDLSDKNTFWGAAG